MIQFEPVRDKKVIISGGTTGIGRATALLLASEGARVLIFGRHQKELHDTLNDINKVGKAYGIIADMTKYEDIINVFREADQKLGGIDILINNAGLAAGSIIDASHDEIDYDTKTILEGHMHCAKEAIERMKRNGKGQIINIGSMSAEVLDPRSDLYVAAKAGIKGFSVALRKKINKDNIKVCLIEPGLVGTSIHKIPPAEQRKQETENKMLMTQDIADVIYWILTRPWRSDIIMLQVKPVGQTGI